MFPVILSAPSPPVLTLHLCLTSTCAVHRPLHPVCKSAVYLVSKSTLLLFAVVAESAAVHLRYSVNLIYFVFCRCFVIKKMLAMHFSIVEVYRICGFKAGFPNYSNDLETIKHKHIFTPREQT